MSRALLDGGGPFQIEYGLNGSVGLMYCYS